MTSLTLRMLFTGLLVIPPSFICECGLGDSAPIYIRVNQVGFLPNEHKTAWVLTNETNQAGRTFTLSVTRRETPSFPALLVPMWVLTASFPACMS